MEIRNARITSTMLGFGRGIPSYMLRLDDEGANFGFGGRVLGDHWTHETVYGLLETVGAESWEELEQKVCRIATNSRYEVFAIGHWMDDKWLWFENNIIHTGSMDDWEGTKIDGRN